MAEKGTGELFCIDSPTIQLSRLFCSSPNLEHYLFELSGRHEITILLSGKTGTGKSHLTNALIGEKLAEEGEELDPQTDDVSYFASKFIRHIKGALSRLLSYLATHKINFKQSET